MLSSLYPSRRTVTSFGVSDFVLIVDQLRRFHATVRRARPPCLAHAPRSARCPLSQRLRSPSPMCRYRPEPGRWLPPSAGYWAVRGLQARRAAVGPSQAAPLPPAAVVRCSTLIFKIGSAEVRENWWQYV